MELPFVTMLFNDESHSYDDVIVSLSKAIECDEEKAMFLASVVDREGRSSIRAGTKEICDKANAEVTVRRLFFVQKVLNESYL